MQSTQPAHSFIHPRNLPRNLYQNAMQENKVSLKVLKKKKNQFDCLPLAMSSHPQ